MILQFIALFFYKKLEPLYFFVVIGGRIGLKINFRPINKIINQFVGLMFGNKKQSWTEQLRVKITKYVDERFEDYRGQIAIDLARGLASLAGFVAIWTLAIVCLIFVAFTLALLLGWGFSFWMQDFAYVLSFLLVALALLGGAYFILKNKKEYIEEPVFKIMSESLRSSEMLEKEAENLSLAEEEDDFWSLPPMD